MAYISLPYNGNQPLVCLNMQSDLISGLSVIGPISFKENETLDLFFAVKRFCSYVVVHLCLRFDSVEWEHSTIVIFSEHFQFCRW